MLSLSNTLRVFLTFAVLLVEHTLRLVFDILRIHLLLDALKSLVQSIGRGLGIGGGVGSAVGRKEAADAAIPDLTTRLAFAGSTEEIVKDIRGLPFESHFVASQDGYLLALHRLPTIGGPPVLLWHGFMMSSEVWVCHPDEAQSMALTLHAAGYDVWLANTRGNKYSCKHAQKPHDSHAFWDFSLDQYALVDVPDTIDYVLGISGHSSLTYIGFSQGTTVGFAALALSPALNAKINLFIALAAVMRPSGLDNSLTNALIQASPEIIYLLFGRKRMVPYTVFWTNILPKTILIAALDKCMNFLFGWKSLSMNQDHKRSFYSHLYSFTSVKSTVHWFQIMKCKRFQMYDEYPHIWPNSVEKSSSAPSSGFHLPDFPTNQITTPVAVLVGGQDSLPDVEFLKSGLRSGVFWLEIEEYEHLDFLWGRHVSKIIIPSVFGLLEQYNPLKTPLSKHSSLNSILPLRSLVDFAMERGTAPEGGKVSILELGNLDTWDLEMDDMDISTLVGSERISGAAGAPPLFASTSEEEIMSELHDSKTPSKAQRSLDYTWLKPVDSKNKAEVDNDEEEAYYSPTEEEWPRTFGGYTSVASNSLFDSDAIATARNKPPNMPWLNLFQSKPKPASGTSKIKTKNGSGSVRGNKEHRVVQDAAEPIFIGL